jgi:hypothetical protein
MIFLVEYDRSTGRTITFKSFEDSQAREAQDSMLHLELSLHHAGIEREVVLLDAADEAILHRTHARYFHESISDLVRAWEAFYARGR